MFIARLIMLILTFILLFIARIKYNNEKTDCSNLLFTIAVISGIAYCILLIIAHFSIFNIPKIVLFITICLYIVLKEPGVWCERFWEGIIITIFVCIITFVTFIFSFEKCETPEIETTICKIMCAKDNSLVNGSIVGGIHYIHGSISEKSVYQYYYYQEDGGIMQGTIPAEFTTIYFIKDGEEPYLETKVTTTYETNKVMDSRTRFFEKTETTYKLYVPAGSVTNVYEFDAE